MNEEQIIEALESSAPNKESRKAFGRVHSSDSEILSHRDSLMKFLEELDGGLTVFEVRESLENYRK